MSDGWCTPGRLLLAAALMTAGCGDAGQAAAGGSGPAGSEWSTAGCQIPRSPQTLTAGGVTMLVTPPTLDAAMARIDAGGRADFADSYAGLEVDQQLVRAVVYRVPSVAFDEFVRTTAQDSCVVVRDAAHAHAELTAWRERVADDMPMWDRRGIRISSVGARHDGVGVEIGTRDVGRARRELPAHYGPAAPLVFVEQGPVVPLPASGPPTAPQPGG